MSNKSKMIQVTDPVELTVLLALRDNDISAPFLIGGGNLSSDPRRESPWYADADELRAWREKRKSAEAANVAAEYPTSAPEPVTGTHFQSEAK